MQLNKIIARGEAELEQFAKADEQAEKLLQQQQVSGADMSDQVMLVLCCTVGSP